MVSIVSFVVSAAQLTTKELIRIAVINFNSITARFLPKQTRLPFEKRHEELLGIIRYRGG